MMSSPRISIIVPVYNAEKTIKESLLSAMSQTIPEIDIICIDNNSSDGSVKVIKEMQKQDGRIRLFTEESQGAGPARNRGIKESKGEFIFFLDPDDLIYSKDTLQRLYELAKSHKVKIVGGSVFIFDKTTSTEQEGDSRYYFEKDGMIEYKDYQFDWGFWRFLYDRSFLVSNGIKFPSYLRGQDTVFFVRAMALAGTFYAIKDRVYQYNHTAASRVHSPQGYIDYEKANLEVIRIAKKNKFSELEKIATSHRMPLVSIIVPVYNTAKSDLQKCLNSIMDQTYENIEVIIVDDGSDKEIADFLDDFASDLRWTILHQDNKGLSAARNEGYEVATGEYVQFLDSDDYFDKNLIASSVSLAIKTDADVVIENFTVNNLTYDTYTEAVNPDSLPVDRAFRLLDLRVPRIGVIPYSVWSKLFKKQFLDRHNILHDERLMRAEDVVFSYSALVQAKRIVFLPEPYITYREEVEGSNSITNDKFPLESVNSWKKLYQLLKSLNVYSLYRDDFERAMVESLSWHLVRLHTARGMQGLGELAQDFMKSIGLSIQNDHTLLLALASNNPDLVKLFKEKDRQIYALQLELERRDRRDNKMKEQISNLNKELNSHLRVGRSIKLVAGNIKRQVSGLVGQD